MPPSKMRQPVGLTPREAAQKKRDAFNNYLEAIGEKEAEAKEVPKSVKEAFTSRYPDGEALGYVRVNRTLYGVFFLDKVWHKYARFSNVGEWDETRVSTLSKDVRKKIISVLRKMMRKRDYDVVHLERVLKPNGVKNWEVLVDTDHGMYRVVIDDNDKVIARYAVDGDPDDDSGDDEKKPSKEDIDLDEDSVDDDDIEVSDDDDDDDDDSDDDSDDKDDDD